MSIKGWNWGLARFEGEYIVLVGSFKSDLYYEIGDGRIHISIIAADDNWALSFWRVSALCHQPYVYWLWCQDFPAHY